MKTQLLIFKKVTREKFIFEDFTPKDHILGIVKQGSLVFDDGSGKQEVSEKECILFRKGIRYLRQVTSPLEMYLFRFTADEDIFHCSKLPEPSSPFIAAALLYLDELHSGSHPQAQFCQQAVLDSILMLYVMADARKRQESITSDPAIDRFLGIVHADVQTKLNFSHIAQTLGMSYIQFLRRFEAATGTTPAEYVIRHRLDVARRHLLDTAQPIKSIALACGYQDAYYFSNAFKKRYGISPSAYRKQAPGGSDDFL